MRKLIIAAAAAALALPAVSTPALAQSGGYEDPDDKDRGYDADEDFDDDADHDADADHDDGGKFEAQPAFGPDPRDRGEGVDQGEPSDDAGAYEGETWRDDEGRLRCRRSDGTTGLVVGAAAGALIGRAIERGARCQ